MQPEILSKPDNKTANIYVKKTRFKHTCNDEAGIADVENRKTRKLCYRKDDRAMPQKIFDFSGL